MPSGSRCWRASPSRRFARRSRRAPHGPAGAKAAAQAGRGVDRQVRSRRSSRAPRSAASDERPAAPRASANIRSRTRGPVQIAKARRTGSSVAVLCPQARGVRVDAGSHEGSQAFPSRAHVGARRDAVVHCRRLHLVPTSARGATWSSIRSRLLSRAHVGARRDVVVRSQGGCRHLVPPWARGVTWSPGPGRSFARVSVSRLRRDRAARMLAASHDQSGACVRCVAARWSAVMSCPSFVLQAARPAWSAPPRSFESANGFGRAQVHRGRRARDRSATASRSRRLRAVAQRDPDPLIEG